MITNDLSGARTLAPYDLILESAGGDALANALGMLAVDVFCVSFANSSRTPTTFDTFDFFLPPGRSRLVGFYLFPTLLREPAGVGLRRLLAAVATGRLKPRIKVEAP